MTESSSSSTERTNGIGYGPFFATKEFTGVWYLDWFVPEDLPTGSWYDLWTFKWDPIHEFKTRTFEFDIYQGDEQLNFSLPAIDHNLCDNAVSMARELENSLIYEVQHHPNHWEEAQRTGRPDRFRLAYKNWRDDPRPMVRINNVIVDDGWTVDMNGNLTLAEPADPEDQVFVNYYFACFSEEEILNFLNEGLYMMNSTPPASEAYTSICSAPFAWRAAIVLYASIQALRRLIFGFNIQERAIMFGEDPEAAQRAIQNYKDLLQSYTDLWNEIRKDAKTRRLPAIYQFVSPEYTLPGGRSRWFRYLYKS
jgi:hypothetical protein